jgi:hypothetical protein
LQGLVDMLSLLSQRFYTYVLRILESFGDRPSSEMREEVTQCGEVGIKNISGRVKYGPGVEVQEVFRILWIHGVFCGGWKPRQK